MIPQLEVLRGRYTQAVPRSPPQSAPSLSPPLSLVGLKHIHYTVINAYSKVL